MIAFHPRHNCLVTDLQDAFRLQLCVDGRNNGGLQIGVGVLAQLVAEAPGYNLPQGVGEWEIAYPAFRVLPMGWA